MLAGGSVETVTDGLENIPDGPVIFASTHQGMLDGFVWITDCPKHADIDKGMLTNLLRDRMAALKWEIWEKQGGYKREDFADSREAFLSRFFDEKNTSVTLEDVLKCLFYPT